MDFFFRVSNRTIEKEVIELHNILNDERKKANVRAGTQGSSDNIN